MKPYIILALAFCLVVATACAQPGNKEKAPGSASTASADPASQRAGPIAAAKSIVRWYVPWEGTENTRTALLKVTDKAGKPANVNSTCPCKLAQQNIDAYLQAVQKTGGPYISAGYIDSARIALAEAKEYFLKSKEFGETYGAFETMWTYAYFRLQQGQDWPVLKQSSILGSATAYEVKSQTATTAVITVTFRTGADWGKIVIAYHLHLVREDGRWKLAGPFEDGKPAKSFKG